MTLLTKVTAPETTTTGKIQKKNENLSKRVQCNKVALLSVDLNERTGRRSIHKPNALAQNT